MLPHPQRNGTSRGAALLLKKKQLNGEKRPSHVKLQLAFFSSCSFGRLEAAKSGREDLRFVVIIP